MTKSPTYVQTELFTTASEKLQADIEKELQIPDPEDKESAIAQLIKDTNENTN